MSDSLLFVLNNRIEIYILHASENIGFNKRIGLLKFCDKLLGLKPL